jgi:hypothetical protein
MIGIGVDEFEMRGAVDRAQAAAVFAIAAVKAEHPHAIGPPVQAHRLTGPSEVIKQTGCKDRT